MCNDLKGRLSQVKATTRVKANTKQCIGLSILYIYLLSFLSIGGHWGFP